MFPRILDILPLLIAIKKLLTNLSPDVTFAIVTSGGKFTKRCKIKFIYVEGRLIIMVGTVSFSRNDSGKRIDKIITEMNFLKGTLDLSIEANVEATKYFSTDTSNKEVVKRRLADLEEEYLQITIGHF